MSKLKELVKRLFPKSKGKGYSGTQHSRLAMESGEEGFDQAAWDRAGVKAKKFMESLHLNTPFPPPPNYDPNNPIDRLVWERAGVKAEKFVSEIDWNGPLSHFVKKSGDKARGSWNPSGGFGGSAHDSVDTKPNVTDNGRENHKTSPEGEKAKKYLQKSLNQLLLGNYSDDVTLLGTAGQVGTGLLGLDLPGDVRDLKYDLKHWKKSPEHVKQTLLDMAGLLPVIGDISMRTRPLYCQKTLPKSGTKLLKNGKTFGKTKIKSRRRSAP